MGNLFSRKPRITQVDRAILSLKTQRRKLSQYQQQLEVVIQRETQIARELVKEKKKDRALLALKKKKMQETLIKQVDAWLLNVEQQLADIEISSKQKAVFDSLKAGHKAIKELQNEINIEDVQKLMDETAEAKAYQEEINAVLGERLSSEDEEAVLEEFESLEIEMTLGNLPKVPQPAISLESVKEEDKKIAVSQKQVLKQAIAELAESPTVSQLEDQKNLFKDQAPRKMDLQSSESHEEEEILDLPDVPTNPPSVVAEKVEFENLGDFSSSSRPSKKKDHELLPA